MNNIPLLLEDIYYKLNDKLAIIKEVTEDHKCKLEIFDYFMNEGDLSGQQT